MGKGGREEWKQRMRKNKMLLRAWTTRDHESPSTRSTSGPITPEWSSHFSCFTPYSPPLCPTVHRSAQICVRLASVLLRRSSKLTQDAAAALATELESQSVLRMAHQRNSDGAALPLLVLLGFSLNYRGPAIALALTGFSSECWRSR